jgi:hypothetical protein
VEKELGPLVVDDEPEAAIGDQAPDFSCARQTYSFMLPTDVGHSSRQECSTPRSTVSASLADRVATPVDPVTRPHDDCERWHPPVVSLCHSRAQARGSAQPAIATKCRSAAPTTSAWNTSW